MNNPILQALKRGVPAPLRPFAGRAYLFVAYNLETLWDRRNGMSPPLRFQRIFGEGGQRGAREGLRRYHVKLGGMQPSHDVLEVGSGYGRMAIALTSYLSPQGSYCGLEPVRRAVRWCAAHITPRFPNFRFWHADVYNKFYNPRGHFLSRDYRFPFADNSFDFIFLNSVFTHMLPADVAHYISEIARVLRPGGRCLATCFLWNEEARRLVEQGVSTLPFLHEAEGYHTTDPQAPEAAIALPQTFMLEQLQRSNLNLVGPIYYGWWCKRDTFVDYQDIIVVEKPRLQNRSA